MSENPTRELDSPQSYIEGGEVKWSGNHYKINFQEPPLTLQDKQNYPHERNYPTRETIEEAQKRVEELRKERSEVKEDIKNKIIKALKKGFNL